MHRFARLPFARGCRTGRHPGSEQRSCQRARRIAGPVPVAAAGAPDHPPLPVDDHRRGAALDSERLPHAIVVLDRYGERGPVLVPERLEGGAIVVQVYGDQDQPLVVELMLERCDSGNLPLAGQSTGQEELEQHGLSPEGRQRKGTSVGFVQHEIADRNRRGDPPHAHRGECVGVCGCSAVTCRDHREGACTAPRRGERAKSTKVHPQPLASRSTRNAHTGRSQRFRPPSWSKPYAFQLRSTRWRTASGKMQLKVALTGTSHSRDQSGGQVQSNPTVAPRFARRSSWL